MNNQLKLDDKAEKASGSLDVDKFQKLDDKYNNYLADFILNIRTIKSFATEKFEINRMKKLEEKCINYLIIQF